VTESPDLDWLPHDPEGPFLDELYATERENDGKPKITGEDDTIDDSLIEEDTEPHVAKTVGDLLDLFHRLNGLPGPESGQSLSGPQGLHDLSHFTAGYPAVDLGSELGNLPSESIAGEADDGSGRMNIQKMADEGMSIGDIIKSLEEGGALREEIELDADLQKATQLGAFMDGISATPVPPTDLREELADFGLLHTGYGVNDSHYALQLEILLDEYAEKWAIDPNGVDVLRTFDSIMSLINDRVDSYMLSDVDPALVPLRLAQNIEVIMKLNGYGDSPQELQRWLGDVEDGKLGDMLVPPNWTPTNVSPWPRPQN
jgi:hypothetical protein